MIEQLYMHEVCLEDLVCDLVPKAIIASCDLFLVCIMSGTYDVRNRTILTKVGEALNVTYNEINDLEKRIMMNLQNDNDELQYDTDGTHMNEHQSRNKKKKMAHVGIAIFGGPLVLRLSGGVLAPVIGAGLASGLSTIGITGAAGFLTNAAGTTSVAITSTAIGVNIGGKHMFKRMGSVRTFKILPIHDKQRVNAVLTVHGWMLDDDDIRLLYSTINCIDGDLYGLFWEPEILKNIGETMNVVTSEAVTKGVQKC